MTHAFYFHSKIIAYLVLLTTTCSFLPVGASEGDSNCVAVLRQLEKRVILLETANKVCGPVMISRVYLGNQHTFLVVHPGETIDCSLNYQVHCSQQKFLDKHHLIVGLEGVGAETCIGHLYGVWDARGTKQFKLVAPLQEGDYDVKVVYYPTDKCEDIFNMWNVLKLAPSNSTTIGILRVRNA